MRRILAPALLLLASPALLAATEGGAGRAPSPADLRAPEALERARALEKTRDWPALAELLGERARRVPLSPEEERLLALALEGLDRLDEAAHHMDLAAAGWQKLGRDVDEKAAGAAVRRLDPLSARREPFVRKVASSLLAAVDDLLEGGDAERALRIAEGLPRIARGKEARAAEAALQRARAAFAKVELAKPDANDAAGNVGTPRPLVEREGRHYVLRCYLEPDVVDRLASLMDDVHAFYVRVYFDGDAKKARGPRATIHVAPDKPAMLANWRGGGEPEGWWSPGTSEVHAYDTRSSSGSLDDMLKTLFHEASHQFMTLLAGGSDVPAWLNEGTSSFFEGTVAMADGRVLWPRAALRRLDSLRFQIASKKPPGLRDVVEYAGPGSYEASYYAWGWGLVYYLQEYEDPTTLRRVYRENYAGYRDEVVTKGAATFETFERWFLGPRAPRNHPDFASFARDWERWILDEVAPLHGRDARARTLRLERIERLLAAANRPAKNGPSVEELLERALVHFEWIRGEIDRDAPDGAILLRQADVFERLGRETSAAALVEKALDLAAEGHFALDDARRQELEKRLSKLDRRNAALRAARQRTNELARTGRTLIQNYREAGYVLRAFTLASDLAAVLGEPLEPLAAELRAEARAKGLLVGAIRTLSAKASDWEPVVPGSDRFEATATGHVLAGARATALVDTTLAVDGEYVVRARIVPESERLVGSAAGLVVAGAPDRGATIVAVDERGLWGVWTEPSGPGSALRRTRTLAPRTPVAAKTAFELTVRVRPDGLLLVQVDDETPLEARLEHAPAEGRRVGLFTKNGTWRFEDACVELVP